MTKSVETKRKNKKEEQKLQNKIKKYWEEIGALVVKFHNGAIYDPYRKVWIKRKKGVSDQIVCYNGRFIACEIKVPGKEPTPEQTEFLEAVNQAGGIGFWTTDLITVQKVVSKIRMTDKVIQRIQL